MKTKLKTIHKRKKELTFQIFGSAGINPSPIIGSNISASIPLQYCSGELSLKMCLAMTGSEMTKKLLGPKLKLKIGP
jgi:hypothetical protein